MNHRRPTPGHSSSAARARRPVRAAFTLVELLVTIGIILLLLSTIVAALSFVNRRAQRANTEFLMGSIRTALERFKADHGYYPPALGVPAHLTSDGVGAVLGWPASPASTATNLVGAGRDLLIPPLNTGVSGTGKAAWWATPAKRQGLQRWHSVTSLPEYLLGYGDRSADGYGTVVDGSTTLPGARETPRLGIRAPGRDGVWGAAMTPNTAPELSAAGIAGYYSGYSFSGTSFDWATAAVGLYPQRNLAIPPRVLQSAAPANDMGNNDGAVLARSRDNLRGTVFGPYLDVRDDSVIGGIAGWDVVPDPSGGGSWLEPRIVRSHEVADFDALPKCLIDYWGRPIRYYRRGYVQLDPSLPDGASDGSAFDLGDFFALRPLNVAPGDAADGIPDLNNDGTTTRSLQGAGFALHSCGPDRRWNPLRRVDAEGYNADNIVETGP